VQHGRTGDSHGARGPEGIRCIHPVQVYLHLKDHPERSTEAAAHLREPLLTGTSRKTAGTWLVLAAPVVYLRGARPQDS
jgi:hypothetical protein